MKPRVACGTSDGEDLVEDRFEESPFFYLYAIDARGANFVEKVENIKEEGDAEDGSSRYQEVASLLKSKSINVLLVHQMGPGIARISENFVPVISHETDIQKALEGIKDNLHLVEREWRKGNDREFVVLEEA